MFWDHSIQDMGYFFGGFWSRPDSHKASTVIDALKMMWIEDKIDRYVLLALLTCSYAYIVIYRYIQADVHEIHALTIHTHTYRYTWDTYIDNTYSYIGLLILFLLFIKIGMPIHHTEACRRCIGIPKWKLPQLLWVAFRFSHAALRLGYSSVMNWLSESL